MDAMRPKRAESSGHDGVFLVGEDAVDEYIARFGPQVLRYDVNAKSYGAGALNFGVAKGKEFKRVLIVPHGPIAKYLKTGDLKLVEKAKTKLHVAVTRAVHSVAFVYGGVSPVVPLRWKVGT